MSLKMPALQERHFDYVLGPNQDSRLASVAPGAVITDVKLQMDSDAPFLLRGRAVRQAYTSDLTQNGLQFVKTRWSGPMRDFRQQDLILESLQMVYFGQCGNPKPVRPSVAYPASGVLTLDLENTGPDTITNLMFFFRGVKLYPWGAVPAYPYPASFKGIAFNYPLFVSQLAPDELRQNNIFTVKPDGDFVVRGGLATFPFLNEDADVFAEVGIILRDFDRKPYSNDYIPLDVLFGSGNFTQAFQLANSVVAPFGTGAGAPGLFYPEIYVPANHQLIYDLARFDGTVHGSSVAQDVIINLIGQKVFPQ